MKEPWKKDTNDRYLETVKAAMSLSTGSLLSPAFFSRNFLDIPPNVKDCKRSEARLHSGYNRVELSHLGQYGDSMRTAFAADLSG